ncbi:FISUMP domain-containing protein [Dysgonomonas sp. 25]|uniref:FISUMP domain-containing protein n=1 Tax=Dysgonomonas sp. 25 TaxID=2302933 RepID=UPI0013D0565E|nr:FISUMP domain-containing protein [Dysgonomonas sp. 25]NDV69210.1 hypothetical protein [Dysgonomonas sp. 25]
MKTLTTALFLSVAIFLSTNLHSQVTIGSSEPPAAGAILDLKQVGTTTKGLGLPRVKLVKRFNSDISTTIDGVAAGAYPGDHTGLLVYHVSGEANERCAAIPSGLYVWDGSKWQPVGGEPLGPIESYTDQDGNEFYARQFGDAGTWMIQNLAAKHYARPDGTADTDNPLLVPDPSVSNDENIREPRYSYPNVDENGTIYPIQYDRAPSTWTIAQGLLYNWAAATNRRGGNTDGFDYLNESQGSTDEYNAANVQGICPKGWHLPTDREWNVLEKELTENATSYAEDVANSAWNTYWEQDAGNWRGQHGKVIKSPCIVKGSPNATPTGGKSLSLGQGGFEVLLVGIIDQDSPSEYGTNAFLSSASGDSAAGSCYREVTNNSWLSDGVARAGYYYRRALMSVRCKKD